MKLITAKDLKGACKNQRALFKKIFPESAPITFASAKKAEKAGLDVWWLVHLLSGENVSKYYADREPLDDDYWAKRKPLDDDYWSKLKPLDDDYEAKRKPLDDDYWAKRIRLLIVALRRSK